MSKKRQPTYGEMSRLMEQMWANMAREKERMAKVMAGALLDDRAAAKLGDYSDTDLKRIMSLLVGHIDDSIASLEAERRAKKEKEDAAQPPAEQERIPLSALHEGAEDPLPQASSSNPASTLSLPIRDSSYSS